MNPEFHGSSKHERSKLYSLNPSTIKGFAERTENQTLLEKLLNVAVDRAFADEFNEDADNVAIFIHQKLEGLRQKERDDLANMESQVQRLATDDYNEARKFFEVFPYFYQDDDPQLAKLEQQHEALFKQR
jgi:hypothetical protein